MTKYETYKDSGIGGIGDIPEHWKVKKLKYLVDDRLKYGANESALYENLEDPRYIRITDFGYNGKLKKDTFKSLPLDIAKDYLLESGDILFARSGATVGKTFQFKDYEGLACFAGYLIKASPDENIVLSDFLYLYTKSSFYDGWKESIFNKATIENIGADKYAFLEIPIPEIKEQEIISNFLNNKTAEIDNLISQKKKLLKLYENEKEVVINRTVTKGIKSDVKLKYSGVECIGDIPVHWEVKRFTYIFNFSRGLGITKENLRTSGIPCINYGEIHSKYGFEVNPDFDFLKCVEEKFLDFSEKSLLNKGDFVFADTSEDIEGSGNFTYLNSDVPTFAGYHTIIARLKNKDKTVARFIAYFFDSIGFRNQIRCEVRGTKVYSITQLILKNTKIILPTHKEQELIVSFIDKEILQINNKVEKTKKLISLLKEYRIALISDVVTGKIKVI